MGEEKRCPVCGRGVLRHLGTEEPKEDGQQPDSPILESYTCGHEVSAGTLDTADAERLEVERRRSEDTA
jgi:hypothetical protein